MRISPVGKLFRSRRNGRVRTPPRFGGEAATVPLFEYTNALRFQRIRVVRPGPWKVRHTAKRPKGGTIATARSAQAEFHARAFLRIQSRARRVSGDSCGLRRALPGASTIRRIRPVSDDQ